MLLASQGATSAERKGTLRGSANTRAVSTSLVHDGLRRSESTKVLASRRLELTASSTRSSRRTAEAQGTKVVHHLRTISGKNDAFSCAEALKKKKERERERDRQMSCCFLQFFSSHAAS